jgi:microcystin-dependent protein
MAFPSTPLPQYSEIFITATGTSGTGDGTAMVPYVCGTASDLDNLINNYVSAKSTINILPGNYTTHGIFLKEGQSLIGQGIGNTTILLTLPTPLPSNPEGIRVVTGNGDGILVENLTLDANSRTLVSLINQQYGIVNLTGNDNTIKNIRGLNPYGSHDVAYGPPECFSISIIAENDADVENALITNCTVEDFLGDYCIGIVFCGSIEGTESHLVNGVISNCHVKGNQWFAYGAASGTIINNLSTDCGIFWRQDTGRVRNLSIIDNKALGCTGAFIIEFTPALYLPSDNSWGENLLIDGNLIEFAESNTGADAGIACYQGAGGTFDGVTIQNNVVLFPSSVTDQHFAWVYSGAFINVTISNNVTNGAKADGFPNGWDTSKSYVVQNNVYQKINPNPPYNAYAVADGLSLTPGAALSEYQIHNDYPDFGCSAGIGAYFGNKRGGMDWEVQPGGDTAWAIRSQSGGVLTTPLYGDQDKNVYIPGVLAMGASMSHVQSGAGSPAGVVSAPAGSIYLQTNGSLPALYVKQSGSAATGWDAVQTPAGTVSDFAGSTAPDGWLLCYGQAVSRTTYARLFAAISTAYGVGDGSTTFNLPDCRGRVSAGKDNMGGTAAGNLTSATISPDAISLNGRGGSETVILTSTQIPSHTHTIGFPQSSYAWNSTSLSNTTTGGGATRVTNVGMSTLPSATNANTPADGAHKNVQPTIIFNKIIKA